MLLFGICAAVFVALAFAIVAFALEGQNRQMSERFTAFARVTPETDGPEDLRGSLHERLIAPTVARLNELALRITPRESAKAMAMQVERAGRPWGMTASMYALIRTGSAAVGILGALALYRFVPMSPLVRIVALGAGAGAGVMGPGVAMDRAIKQRQMAVRRAMPDIIDLLVVSVEAGMGLDAAVQEVVQRRRGPLVDELARVLGEVRVGKSRRSAWQDMAIRVDILELKGLVAALVQGEELGASVSGILQGQSQVIRERRSIHVREMAAVLPVKMLFPLVFFIFPGMFVVILGPGMISMMGAFKSISF